MTDHSGGSDGQGPDRRAPRAAAPIPLTVVGCDFRRASSRWRSCLVLDDRELRAFHRELRASGPVDGLLALQTCNRNEWIAAGTDPAWAAGLLTAQMKHRVGRIAPGNPADAGPPRWFQPYVFTGERALRHLLRVALGRESLVVGEQQIAGQIHDALEGARAAGTSSRALNHLGPITGRLLRAARARTGHGATGRGVHSLALHWLRQRLARAGSARARVVIIGTGSIGRQLWSMVEREPGMHSVVVNRTPGHQAVRPWTDLPELLARADAAVLCTGAREPVFRARQTLARRTRGPLPLLDLGIPHQIDPDTRHPGLELAGIDELCDLARGMDGSKGPEAGDLAAQLDTLCDRAVDEYRILCGEAGVCDVLDTVRRQHRQAVYRDIPRLVGRHFHHLPETDRSHIEEDLQRILRDCADEVFREIKESSLRERPAPDPQGTDRQPDRTAAGGVTP